MKRYNLYQQHRMKTERNFEVPKNYVLHKSLKSINPRKTKQLTEIERVRSARSRKKKTFERSLISELYRNDTNWSQKKGNWITEYYLGSMKRQVAKEWVRSRDSSWRNNLQFWWPAMASCFFMEYCVLLASAQLGILCKQFLASLL